MATAKKATSSRPAKATVKTTPKKSTPKKTSAKRTSKKPTEMQSFHVYPENQPFTAFKITRQTVYWVLLVAFIVFVQLWILKLQVEVAQLIDNQEMTVQNNDL